MDAQKVPEQEGPDIFLIRSENISSMKEHQTNETPVGSQRGSGIDIVNNDGVISLDSKKKQKTEVVQCGCYKMGKDDKN